MPKLSDTMEEGKILQWHKQVGDPVRIGEIIAEVETDKANMELEAYDEGVLAEVWVSENESAPVGAVIGGLLLGVLLNMLSYLAQYDFLDWFTEELRLPMALLLILVVLLVKPSGLFGRPEVKRV